MRVVERALEQLVRGALRPLLQRRRLRRTIPVVGDVRVQIDEAGDRGVPSQVHFDCPFRDRHARTDGNDLRLVNEHGHVVREPRAVPHMTEVKGGGHRGPLLCGRDQREQPHAEGK